MLLGIIYSAIILAACILGAVVGLGGGLFIRPALDAIGQHNVMNIAFFSSTAVMCMAIVSTVQKARDGTRIDARLAACVSASAVAGGIVGNLLLEHLLAALSRETHVQYVQIAVTIPVLILSLVLTEKRTLRCELAHKALIIPIGVGLGIVASFLGIGGGPLNVPLFMIFFGLRIKEAAAYSIIVILFSHLSRLVTLGLTVGYGGFDLALLPFVIAAAAVGGLLGAKLNKVFSEKTVKRLFQAALCLVILMNLANAFFFL